MKLARTKEWRESVGLTQRRLAAEAGVGEVTVARIETGASVTPPTARKIADALGVSVADLMERPPVPLAGAPSVSTSPDETPGTGPTATEEVPPNASQISEADRRRLSEILDTLIGGMRRLCDDYGPYIRLLVNGPPSANTSPDDPPPERLFEKFAQLKSFRTTCKHVEDIVDGLASSETVSPWLSRMNDPATPIDIRQKLHDFENAREELFGNLEPFARVWMDANREHLSAEERAELSAKFGYSPGERAKSQRDRS